MGHPRLSVTDARIFEKKENPWGLSTLDYGTWREYFKVSGYIVECQCGNVDLGSSIQKPTWLEVMYWDGIRRWFCNWKCRSDFEAGLWKWNYKAFSYPKVVKGVVEGDILVTQAGYNPTR